jgi:hypothetical protein
MDDDYSQRPIARWFMPAAVAALLFMALGCASYLMHVLTDPATVTIDRRAALEAQPAWVTAAYAIAVWGGLAGTILLVMKRGLAEQLLLVSVAAVLVWLAGLLVVGRLREALSATDLVVAIVVTALTWTIFWFARHSRQRGWLR